MLTILLLLSALIVPRTAWAAHEAGHDQAFSATVEHVHHGDHSHNLAASEQDDQHNPLDSGDDSKLPHDHLAADILSAMAGGDSVQALDPAPSIASLRMPERHRAPPPSSLPDSLLRPPRAA